MPDVEAVATTGNMISLGYPLPLPLPCAKKIVPIPFRQFLRSTVYHETDTARPAFHSDATVLAHLQRLIMRAAAIPPTWSSAATARHCSCHDRVGVRVTRALPSGTPFDVSRLPGGSAIERWEACTAIVEDRTGGGTSREEASGYLSRAFGWSGQSYWREAQVEIVPTEEQVNSVFDFLTDENDLGLEPLDLASLLKKFPQVLGCDVETCLRKNVKVMESTWGIKGLALKNTAKRNPSFLGFIVDCSTDGGCIGECNRCWVRF